MMIDKRLIGTVPESRKYIAANVTLQWCGLVANVAMMMSVASLLASQLSARASSARLLTTAAVAAAAVLIRWLCTTGAARMSDLSSRAVKKTLRTQIYEKLLRLGASYSEHVSTAEVVQVAVEGVDQLETYFGAYLPQFFYAMLAPLTLFAVLCFVNMPAAFALLVCVPLIPVAIAAVQTWAKKLLSRYWGQYTKLGDTFLENLQGLTTLKIYQADGLRNDVMNEEAEKFRKITMKVLTMQLNSVTIMDVIAYGGSALGVILAATQYRAGHVALSGALLIILLSADFFIPMRQLGSFFHIAMNGMAASEKIFRLLDLPEPPARTQVCPDGDIVCRGLIFPTLRSGRSCMGSTSRSRLVRSHRSSARPAAASPRSRPSLWGAAAAIPARSRSAVCRLRIFPRTASCATSPMSATRATCSRAPCAKICAWHGRMHRTMHSGPCCGR